jgi:hypothetical protein
VRGGDALHTDRAEKAEEVRVSSRLLKGRTLTSGARGEQDISRAS